MIVYVITLKRYEFITVTLPSKTMWLFLRFHFYPLAGPHRSQDCPWKQWLAYTSWIFPVGSGQCLTNRNLARNHWVETVSDCTDQDYLQHEWGHSCRIHRTSGFYV